VPCEEYKINDVRCVAQKMVFILHAIAERVDLDGRLAGSSAPTFAASPPGIACCGSAQAGNEAHSTCSRIGHGRRSASSSSAQGEELRRQTDGIGHRVYKTTIAANHRETCYEVSRPGLTTTACSNGMARRIALETITSCSAN